jgi:hypothetical protein
MGVIGDIAGAFIGAKAAKNASKAQIKSAELGIGEMARQYDQTRQDMAPWQRAGSAAIGSLSDMLQPGYDHTTSPGYQFRFNEGQRAVESGGAARGMLMSGGTLKDLTRFGQGIASDDFNDQFNRTASVAAGGQQVNSTLGQLGAQNSAGIADLRTQQGNARASGYVGQANSWIGGINNVNDRLSSMAKMFGGF